MTVRIDPVVGTDSRGYYCVKEKFYSDMCLLIAISVNFPQPSSTLELSIQESQREDNEEDVIALSGWPSSRASTS